MEQVKVFAPAKVNLSLDIVGIRRDGYHLMQMVMQTVGLFDVVYAEPRREGITLDCGISRLPTDNRNLAVQAAAAFFRHTGRTGGAALRLVKQIPSGAGMGGGSADAAAVLAAPDKLYNTRLPREELCALGETVGADVPFCFHGGTALVEGIGERITPLRALPRCWITVVKPGISVNTRTAFAAFDQGEVSRRPDTPALLAALESRSLPALAREMVNVFEETAALPELRQIKQELLRLGALGAVMTGSGSAVFGLFADRRQAALARRRLEGNRRQSFLCEPVSHGPLIQAERISMEKTV